MIKKGLGVADLSCIPYYCRGKKIYQWEQSIGKTVKFTYKGISGEFKIISVPKRGCICVEFKGKEYKLWTEFVVQGALGKLFKDQIHWIYSENQRKIDHPEGKQLPRDITITKRIFDKNRRKSRTNKFYGYVCNKCGYNTDMDDGLINEQELKSGRGCSCCSGYKTVVGINDIATKAKWILPYLVDKQDGNRYWRTQKKLLMKCPDCGTIKLQSPEKMLRQRFGCNGCSDGISYGEKFLSKLFEQSNISYVWQLNKKSSTDGTFSWCQKYKYDFYLPDYCMIVEVHGKQHYDEGKHFFEDYSAIHKNDIIKKEIAENNGYILNKNYVVIDASESNSDYILDSVRKSPLSKLLDWKIMDISTADKFASKSILFTICEEWVKRYPQITTKILQSEYPFLSRSTITRYLKKGAALGICNYNDVKTGVYERINKASRPIKVVNNISNDEYFFRNHKLLEENFRKVFGTGYKTKSLNDAIQGRLKSYHNLSFKDISKETFNNTAKDKNQLHVYGEPFILDILS